MKRDLAADIWAIFNAPDQAQSEAQLLMSVGKYAQSAFKLTDWLEATFRKV